MFGHYSAFSVPQVLCLDGTGTVLRLRTTGPDEAATVGQGTHPHSIQSGKEGTLDFRGFLRGNARCGGAD